MIEQEIKMFFKDMEGRNFKPKVDTLNEVKLEFEGSQELDLKKFGLKGNASASEDEGPSYRMTAVSKPGTITNFFGKNKFLINKGPSNAKSNTSSNKRPGL